MISPQKIQALIDSSEKSVCRMGKKTLVVTLTLPNGFEITDSGSCINPEDFNQERGEEAAMKRIHNRLWELEGYAEHRPV